MSARKFLCRSRYFLFSKNINIVLYIELSVRLHMKNSVYFQNSPRGARKTNDEYKKERARATRISDGKEDVQGASLSGMGSIYNQWLLLCAGLCLCFLLLITSGDRIKSVSRSDGVMFVVDLVKEKIDDSGSIAVFFGFNDESEQSDAPTVQMPEINQEDIPVFTYGDGLDMQQYINKYNSENYSRSGTVPVMGIISSDYSFRKNPFYGVYSDEPQYEFHSGVDIAADEGDDIHCYLDGIVEKTALSASYGYYVIVDHGQGLKTLYAHASKVLCDIGDTVEKGQVIACVGSTGRATGPHLHFEITEDGSTQNPKEYLRALYEYNS